MARITLPAVNKAIAADVAHVELVKGEGYFYLIFDDGEHYETLSIMVYRLNELPIEAWIQEARDFAARFA